MGPGPCPSRAAQPAPQRAPRRPGCRGWALTGEGRLSLFSQTQTHDTPRLLVTTGRTRLNPTRTEVGTRAEAVSPAPRPPSEALCPAAPSDNTLDPSVREARSSPFTSATERVLSPPPRLSLLPSSLPFIFLSVTGNQRILMDVPSLRGNKSRTLGNMASVCLSGEKVLAGNPRGRGPRGSQMCRFLRAKKSFLRRAFSSNKP